MSRNDNANVVSNNEEPVLLCYDINQELKHNLFTNLRYEYLESDDDESELATAPEVKEANENGFNELVKKKLGLIEEFALVHIIEESYNNESVEENNEDSNDEDQSMIEEDDSSYTYDEPSDVTSIEYDTSEN